MPLLPIDAAGLSFIKAREGLHDGDKRTPNLLEPEKDPVGIFTIGWGYALTTDKEASYAKWRKMFPNGMTLADADALLLQVINSWAPRLDDLVKVSLNQAQSNAIRSLTYNIGIGVQDGVKGDFADSTLLARLNKGDFKGASEQFLVWNKGGRPLRVIDGLSKRRADERAVFDGK